MEKVKFGLEVLKYVEQLYSGWPMWELWMGHWHDKQSLNSFFRKVTCPWMNFYCNIKLIWALWQVRFWGLMGMNGGPVKNLAGPVVEAGPWIQNYQLDPFNWKLTHPNNCKFSKVQLKPSVSVRTTLPHCMRHAVCIMSCAVKPNVLARLAKWVLILKGQYKVNWKGQPLETMPCGRNKFIVKNGQRYRILCTYALVSTTVQNTLQVCFGSFIFDSGTSS